jgi:large subunit ribosomal protein L3
MEFIVEKIGMSRTIEVGSIPVTLCLVKDMKVCDVFENNQAIVAFPNGKKTNKAIQGQQKKYSLSSEFNTFRTLKVANNEAGDIDTSPLESGAVAKVSFKSKGRGFAGVFKRYNFAGGMSSHGSRFHRRVGSIGNAEYPGRVMKGKKMPGRHGGKTSTHKNEIISFDTEKRVLVLKGSVAGANGALGVVKVG